MRRAIIAVITLVVSWASPVYPSGIWHEADTPTPPWCRLNMGVALIGRDGARAALVESLRAAAGFHLTIGNPVALYGTGGNGATLPPGLKTKAFMAVRAEACATPSNVQLTATAEGQVGEQRRSQALAVAATTQPGVFAIPPPPSAGQWVIVLSATCGNDGAGAIVPIGVNGFDRDASAFYPRAATAAEIDAAIRKAAVR